MSEHVSFLGWLIFLAGCFSVGRGMGVYWADRDVTETAVCLGLATVLFLWSILIELSQRGNR